MKPIEKIYYAFYKSKKNELYFNELKEISGLLDSSLNKNLKELIQTKEIKKDEQKSNTYYSLKNVDLISAYFTKFDIEKLNNLDYKIKIPLKELLEKIEKIQYIIHFGSSSRGEEKKGSDIDLLIVLHTFENKELQKLYLKEIKESSEKLKNEIQTRSLYKISVFYVDYQTYLNNKTDNLINSAKNTGYPIYNQIEYYKNEYRGVNIK